MSEPSFGNVFVAIGDGFLCEECAREKGIDLGDDATEVWQVGSTGWTGACVCSACKLSIPVYVDAPVSAEEIATWIAARPFQDITGASNVRRFSASLREVSGERELSDEAQEALYARYPRVMAKLETDGT